MLLDNNMMLRNCKNYDIYCFLFELGNTRVVEFKKSIKYKMSHLKL